MHATRIGISMLDSIGTLATGTDILQILSDALANKATGTLLKRAGSLWRYANWIMARGVGTPFDQSEIVLYEYLNYLRNSDAAATSASHFIEALRFFDTVFSCTAMDVSQALSSRVRGAAHSMFLKKRKLQQAPAFTLEAVQCFEQLCLEDNRAHVRVICGAILFCILACVRWFDAMRIESVRLDKYITMCIVEAETSRHKTSMSKESKTRLLPYTCLGRFLASAEWAQSFSDAREESGLNQQSLFVPAWNEVSQTWSPYPMSSGEATCWIRELLHQCGISDVDRFSSHSCKCTLLTWAGMCTIFTREERTLLGHHVEPQTKSSTTYSRDSQILLQYKVTKLLSLLRSEKLKPDASRAERLNMLVAQGSGDQDSEIAAEWQEPEIAASDEDSDDVHADHCDDSLDDLNRHLNDVRAPIPDNAQSYVWFIHAFTSVAHAMHTSSDPDSGKLLCGRTVSINLRRTRLDSLEMKTGLMCMQCNGIIKRDSGHDEANDFEEELLGNGPVDFEKQN